MPIYRASASAPCHVNNQRCVSRWEHNRGNAVIFCRSAVPSPRGAMSVVLGLKMWAEFVLLTRVNYCDIQKYVFCRALRGSLNFFP